MNFVREKFNFLFHTNWWPLLNNKIFFFNKYACIIYIYFHLYDKKKNLQANLLNLCFFFGLNLVFHFVNNTKYGFYYVIIVKCMFVSMSSKWCLSLYKFLKF